MTFILQQLQSSKRVLTLLRAKYLVCSSFVIPYDASLIYILLVDAAGKVHLYDLSQQARLTSPALWGTFTALACALKKKNIRVSFFSATPQGGGVALMRHALIRLWRKSMSFFHTR